MNFKASSNTIVGGLGLGPEPRGRLESGTSPRPYDASNLAHSFPEDLETKLHASMTTVIFKFVVSGAQHRWSRGRGRNQKFKVQKKFNLEFSVPPEVQLEVRQGPPSSTSSLRRFFAKFQDQGGTDLAHTASCNIGPSHLPRFL